MDDNYLLGQINQRTLDTANDVKEIKTHLTNLPCAEQQVKTENIDGRLRPIERIVWKVFLTAISVSLVAGGIAGAFMGK